MAPATRTRSTASPRSCGFGTASGSPRSRDPARTDAVGALVAGLERCGTVVGIPIGNAGVGGHGPFGEGDPDGQHAMIRDDASAPTEPTRCPLPGMLARYRGRVPNDASTASFPPGPFMAVHSATEALLFSFSETIAEEPPGSGATVTALCPGPTATGFAGMLVGKRVVIPGRRNRPMAGAVRFVPAGP